MANVLLTDEKSPAVNEIKFAQVESEKQKKEAGSLIREYLEWLNDLLWRKSSGCRSALNTFGEQLMVKISIV